jgi:riboflavin synthase
MFTGLVTDVGAVEQVIPHEGGVTLKIRPGKLNVDKIEPGESISVSGCCLTVVEIAAGLLAFDVVPESLSRTTMGRWSSGTDVNLERALTLNDRLGGHLVLGHVDCVGEVLDRSSEGSGARIAVRLPAELAPLVAEKGSISIDGVSLTVAKVQRDRFEAVLIPETLERTTLGAVTPGVTVNLEADVIARHLARLMELK